MTAVPFVRLTRRNGSIHDRPRPLTEREIASDLRQIESLVARLSVHHSDPERFHIERSEIKARIGALAKKLEGR